MLKILGRETSSNVMKILWLCSELKLDFERINLGGKYGGNDTADYLALNPNGLVPVIIDGSFVTWESNSCLRYLAAKYGHGRLYPKDLQQRAIIERWMDWQGTTMSPAMVPVFRTLIRSTQQKQNMKEIEKARKVLSEKIAIIDQTVAKNNFIAGETFSIGDIPLGIAAWRWFNMPIEREEYPFLKRWYDSLSTRPGYQKHVMKPLS